MILEGTTFFCLSLRLEGTTLVLPQFEIGGYHIGSVPLLDWKVPHWLCSNHYDIGRNHFFLPQFEIGRCHTGSACSEIQKSH